MSNEKKNEVTEDIETERRALTPEELEQVTGGITIHVGVQLASVAGGKLGDVAGFQSVR